MILNEQLFKEYPDVLNAVELQRALGIGRAGAYRLLEQGKIKNFKVGNAYKIPRTALLEYIEKSCERGEEQ